MTGAGAAILFWFYRSPGVTADRLAGIRRRNPGAKVYGLYGGPSGRTAAFARVADLLDDVWAHPPAPPDWAWRNGDLMVARWHADRGQHLPWDDLFVHQWDLLTTRPAAAFTAGPSTTATTTTTATIIVAGARPLAEVAGHWVWVQPWSHHRAEFDAFTRHRAVRGRPLWASIFVYATLPRPFLNDFAAVTATEGVPGFVEYRLPTLAAALGYAVAPGPVRPDWGDRGDPLVNGDGRVVDAATVRHRLAATAAAAGHTGCVCHPVRVADPRISVTAQRGALVTDVPTHVPTDIAVVQVPPARPGLAAGGSQFVAAVLASGMAAAGERVHLLSGTADDADAAGDAEAVIDGVHYQPAFGITDAVLAHGAPSSLALFPEAVATARRCRAAVMFDRVFPLPPGVFRVLALGTMAYDFAREAVRFPGWDQMIVPSEYVRDAVVRCLLADDRADRLGRAGRVHVVPNPVDPASIGLTRLPPVSPPRQGNRIRLLYPHRGDTGKGMAACLRLLARLAATRDVELAVVIDTAPTADRGFYPWLDAEARRLGVGHRLAFEPWRPMRDVAALYRSADLTLCLGDLPEGFGLVSLESVLCGTPVLARAVGAQTTLLPPGCGCVAVSATYALADTAADDAAIAAAAEQLLSDPNCAAAIARGGDLVRSRFSRAAFLAGVGAVLNPGPSRRAEGGQP